MWEIDFISEHDYTNHVKQTINNYRSKYKPFDLDRFNQNIIDPVKLLFDKSIYGITWDEIVGNEIFRQRDKSNNNSLGYFHQGVFNYIDKCHVPSNGTEGGWDVIFEDSDGIYIPEADITVRTIYV